MTTIYNAGWTQRERLLLVAMREKLRELCPLMTEKMLEAVAQKMVHMAVNYAYEEVP